MCTHYVCSWVTLHIISNACLLSWRVGLCIYTHMYTHTQLVHILCTPDDSYHSMIWHGPPFPRDHDVIVFAVESITKFFSHLNISRERREDYCYITRLILSSSKLQRYEQHMRSKHSSCVIYTLYWRCAPWRLCYV